MKCGVFSLAMPEYTPEEAVCILSEIGYDGVEWRVSNAAPPNKPDGYTHENRYWSYNRCTLDVTEVDRIAPSIKRLCDGTGLEICSLTTYLRPWETDGVRRVLKAAAVMCCGNVRVSIPGYDASENYNAVFERTIRQTEALASLSREFGVRINYEQHMETIIPSASAAYRLVSNFDPKHIGIIFDPGNMVFEGFEKYQMAVELLGNYLAHVHMKNAAWGLAETTDAGVMKWKPQWAPLKSGYADLERAGRVLREAGYKGYICLEDFSNEVDTLTKLKESYSFMQSL